MGMWQSGDRAVWLYQPCPGIPVRQLRVEVLRVCPKRVGIRAYREDGTVCRSRVYVKPEKLRKP